MIVKTKSVNSWSSKYQIKLMCRPTYIFDPNERANVRNVVVGIFGSAYVVINRQIHFRSAVWCESDGRDEQAISRGIRFRSAEAYEYDDHSVSGVKNRSVFRKFVRSDVCVSFSSTVGYSELGELMYIVDAWTVNCEENSKYLRQKRRGGHWAVANQRRAWIALRPNKWTTTRWRTLWEHVNKN